MPLPAPRTVFNDLLIAASLLTRLPIPHADWSHTSRPPARAAWAYPLVGGLVAALAMIVGVLAQVFNLSDAITAALMLVVLSVTTGAMHEDGLADCADGFWGGWEPARRLDIMKDSHIGAYGVLALVAGFGLKWAAVTALIGALPLWMIAAPAIMSRAAMVAVMQYLPHARSTGLSSQTGKPGQGPALVAIAFGVCAAIFAPGTGVLLIVALLAATAVAAIAKRKIAGQTGDVLGACQVVTEIALLITVSAQAISA